MADLTDIHAAILRKAKKSKPDESKITPESYVHRIADLEDPQEVADTIRSRARNAAACKFPHENLMRESFRAWMQILDPEKKEDKWRSKRFIPLLFQHIESAHPALAAAVFGGPRIWSVEGETPEGRDHAEAVNQLLHAIARGKSRMKAAYQRALWWAIVGGTGVLDHFWLKEMIERLKAVVEDDFDGAGRPLSMEGMVIDPTDTQTARKRVKVMRKQLITVFDEPRVQSTNPFDVWFDPNGRVGNQVDWGFLRYETTLDKVVQAAEQVGSHLDKAAVKDWLNAAEMSKIDLDFRDEQWDTDMNLSAFDDLLDEVGYVSPSAEPETDQKLHGGRRVVLLVHRTKSEVFTLAPGGRIIGWSDNPNAHGLTGWLIHHMYEIDDCPYGRGIGSVILPHQELVNENINRAMDVDEISLMAPVGVDRSRVSVLDEKFRWQPNAIVRTRGDPRTAVARLDLPAPTEHAMLWDQHFKKDADDTTGMTEQARGIMPSGVNTATAFSGLQANIKVRTFMQVERLNETLELSANLLIELLQQYMTKERVIQIIGEPGLNYKTIAPTDITGDFIVRGCVTAGRMAPAMKIQQLISLTQVIVPILQQAPNSPFLTRWIRMILTEAEVEEVDRLIPRNQDKMRDPWQENIALRRGVPLQPSPFDRHDLHIEAHSEEFKVVEQLVAEQQAEPEELTQLMAHMQLHMEMGQALASPMAGTAPPQAAPGGGPERQEAQTLGAAQGSNGVKGKASPGPAAPPGRSA